ncbi:hypothetical protein AB0C93_12000 [Streptomyces sp. NPDC048518]|uniref:hypothetical protein n=1 Tax=Streptomyces sp. NPDC048518 TaxID=3155029 RepID=UPI0033DD37AD
MRFALSHLGVDAMAHASADAALLYARERWGWLLRQSRPASLIWTELRKQVCARVGCASVSVTSAAAICQRLPRISADSVLLCHELKLPTSEAAELMGLESAAVEAALEAAWRSLTQLPCGARI